jgi:alkaline phosphatase D
MDARTSRRHFLYGGAAAGAGLWLPADVLDADARSRRKVPHARAGRFATGVMSGDPSPTAVTLWTRLHGQPRDRVRVELEVARDPAFRRVVLRRLVPTRRSRDHTVKVRVGGLKPDRRYWFRFSTRTTTSPVGRTQTAPAPDSRRPVKVGYFACQSFTTGFYGAYRALLAEDPDIVICGGDYIYERVFDGYEGPREDTIGADGDSVARSLADYRAKYRLYRSDQDLRELHRLVPFVAQWDDHEVADNYIGTLPEGETGSPDDGDPREAFDRARIRAGWRAWHEYMPALRFRGSRRTYRSLRLGRTAEVFMCDSRSYRDDQPCGGGTFVRCEDDAPRQYLGERQLSWLKDGLERTPADWRLVGNQLMIMPFQIQGGVKVEVDSWQGYPRQRGELLSHLEQRQIPDVVFLTGDIHTFFAGSVLRDGTEGPAVASEIVGGSTTSPGTAEVLSETSGGVPPELIEPLSDSGVPANNPWITYADTRTHGCTVLDVGPEEVRARNLGSRDVKTLEGSRDVREIADLRVRRGTPGVAVALRS